METRVTTRKQGYRSQKRWVRLKETNRRTSERREVRQGCGYVSRWEPTTDGRKVYLRYQDGRRPAVHEVRRISKKSRPVHVTHETRWGVRQGRGVRIRETTAGMRTDEMARQRGRGGTVRRQIV